MSTVNFWSVYKKFNICIGIHWLNYCWRSDCPSARWKKKTWNNILNCLSCGSKSFVYHPLNTLELQPYCNSRSMKFWIRQPYVKFIAISFNISVILRFYIYIYTHIYIYFWIFIFLCTKHSEIIKTIYLRV